MDRKHVKVQAPINSSTQFFSYRYFFSIVLMATTIFCLLMLGVRGEFSDGGVFSNAIIYRKMVNDTCLLEKFWTGTFEDV